MINASTIYAIADSHLTLHLLAPGEADVSPVSEGQDAEGASADDAGSAAATILPENLIEDFVDEALVMFEDVADLYSQRAGWERALVFGFVDGVLSAADDSWSTYEDSYFEDADNEAFSALDDTIVEIAEDFDGSRPWDEAAKGYVREVLARSDEDPAQADQDLWAICAHGFIYGVDAAYDQEWKLVVTPAGNVLLTDEDSMTEAALAQLEAESGSGSLIDQVFDMIGIDLGALAAELGAEDEEGGESLEAELLEVEDGDDAAL